MFATESLRQLLGDDMKAVDDVIRRRLRSDVALINQMAEYIIGAGGKRMRPALVLLAAGVFGHRGGGQHELAAIVEFIHTATLLHDDVVDESDLRRGRATANALFGNAASVLVGDFLYSRAFQMMVDLNHMRVMAVLADTTNRIAEGEVLQLLNSYDADTDESHYLTVIRYKTAELFQAAARLGSIIARAKPVEEEALANYGLKLGMAFQLIDDVLDYSGDREQTGKNVGDDLAQGKVTLPLIQAMTAGRDADRQLIRGAIKQGGRAALQEIVRIVKETGALEYVKQRAQVEADAAKAAIVVFPNSIYRECLINLCEFAVGRSH
ncbi:MAG: polyprenyl synthetase family protein [Burkholderiales bacterium]|nr:polyprenyl synthetase family protein [Pseudomonadota bacterium]